MDYETSVQVAARLGIDRSQISRYAKAGRFPGAIRPGHDWLIPTGSLPTAMGSGRPPSWREKGTEDPEDSS